MLRLPYASLVEEGRAAGHVWARDGEVTEPASRAGGESSAVSRSVYAAGSGSCRSRICADTGPAVPVRSRSPSMPERSPGTCRRRRDHLLAAATEERQRLHRELHDSLGPVLTGAALKADSAALAAHSDPRRAEQLAAQLADQLRAAIDDVRRLSYGLRPTSLDQLGLVGALRQHESEVGGLTPHGGGPGRVARAASRRSRSRRTGSPARR